MIILENKRGAKLTLPATAILFVAGYILYSKYHYGASAIFTMTVSVICAIFCVKKIFQESFLRLDDDGFFVKKGKKEGKFYFKDIQNIDTRTIDSKKGVQILSVQFKRDKLDLSLANSLIQPLGKDEAVIMDNYERSIYDLRNDLRDKFQNFKAS
ncbi:molybdate transport repressor [Campylobacter mucosalis]|uniref:molybdate transport repressor n=1 Tax=Campylobacter mucosalis TaxID=202 RepID=UPI0014703A2A|nr:molybdate transport repressor [Campylobacter mucosalis]